FFHHPKFLGTAVVRDDDARVSHGPRSPLPGTRAYAAPTGVSDLAQRFLTPVLASLLSSGRSSFPGHRLRNCVATTCSYGSGDASSPTAWAKRFMASMASVAMDG